MNEIPMTLNTLICGSLTLQGGNILHFDRSTFSVRVRYKGANVNYL